MLDEQFDDDCLAPSNEFTASSGSEHQGYARTFDAKHDAPPYNFNVVKLETKSHIPPMDEKLLDAKLEAHAAKQDAKVERELGNIRLDIKGLDTKLDKVLDTFQEIDLKRERQIYDLGTKLEVELAALNSPTGEFKKTVEMARKTRLEYIIALTGLAAALLGIIFATVSIYQASNNNFAAFLETVLNQAVK